MAEDSTVVTTISTMSIELMTSSPSGERRVQWLRQRCWWHQHPRNRHRQPRCLVKLEDLAMDVHQHG